MAKSSSVKEIREVKATALREEKSAKSEKKEKQRRIAYPGLKIGPDGKPTVRLKEWPADFDPKIHEPLNRKDFENEAPWLIARAERLERMAQKLRKEADTVLKFGDRKTRNAVKRVEKMKDTLKKHVEQLRAQGVGDDVIQQMLAVFGGNEE